MNLFSLIFTTNTKDGVLAPHRFEDGFRTVDSTGHSGEANSDDVLFDHVRRGNRVWMSRAGVDPILIDPKLITVQFR